MKQVFTRRDRELQEFEKEVPPSNYMVWGILSSLFCLPVGIVSIVKASRVDSKWSSGDYEGAWKSSESAKKWGAIFMIAGITFIAAFFIFYYIIFATTLKT